VRVLFSSTFGYGHMFPMYPLARAFLAAGHDVLWATSADAGDRLHAAGLPAARCPVRPGRCRAP
jgi:UDP:flavonoid glycosyltransferase YjiC (YdhE family)